MFFYKNNLVVSFLINCFIAKFINKNIRFIKQYSFKLQANKKNTLNT